LFVVTLIGKYSNKVVDLIIKSTFCQVCNYWQKKDEKFEAWYEEHEGYYVSNHIGKMEVDGVKCLRDFMTSNILIIS